MTVITDTDIQSVALASSVTMSANQSCVKTALNASGDAPIYACRAWVKFNGSGTPASDASGNVSSITDLGTGYYQVNITSEISTNASLLITNGDDTPNTNRNYIATGGQSSTTAFYISIYDGSAQDPDNVYVAIFR